MSLTAFTTAQNTRLALRPTSLRQSDLLELFYALSGPTCATATVTLRLPPTLVYA